MNRLAFFVISACVFVLLPLVGEPRLMVRPEILYVILSIGILNFTQPALGKQEAATNKGSDKNTVLLVIICTGLSIGIPVLDYAYLREATFNPIWFVIGIVLNLSGLLLRAWAIRVLGKFFTATVQIQEEHQLVRIGPYRILRHPSYTGAALAVIGLSVVLSSWAGIISSVILLSTAYYFRITAEEKELETFFGQGYIEYAKSTFRIVPYIW